MTTYDTIRAFIDENRDIARIQAQRWEGVDPSRLLQALDYLEGVIESAPTVSLNGKTYNGTVERCVKVTQETVATLTELRKQLAEPIELHAARIAIDQDIGALALCVVPISMELTGLIPRETVEALWGMVQTGKVRVIP